jgi:hypothetical protein
MLVIVGLSVVIGAAIAHAASAKAAHPPTENMRARLSPLGVHRRDAFTNRAHDTRLQHQQRADAAVRHH